MFPVKQSGEVPHPRVMQYRLLGRSGLKASELCLGTMTFGEEWGWGSSKEVSKKIYDEFREAGGNFIDTANVYTNNTSETFLGEFTKGHRDEVVLATKYSLHTPGKDVNSAGNNRKNMMQSVESSLKRLQTDHIDLYWLHIWDFLTPVEEVIRGFDDLVRQGKILYAGISDTPAWIVARAQTIADLRGWSPFVALQIEYSLAERTVERELIPMARELGLGVTAWSPLAGGLLTGKYKQSSDAGRLANAMMQGEQKLTDQRKRIVEAVLAVAKETGKSAAQVAIAWLRQQPGEVIPIIGARTLEQFRDNLASQELWLSEDQMKRLDEASRIELGFPYDFYEKPNPLSLAFAGYHDRIEPTYGPPRGPRVRAAVKTASR